MEFLQSAIDIFLNLDEHLLSVVSQYGSLTYALLFIIIFMETGLVVTPFLPGDSLLFATGALSGGGALNIGFVFILLSFAAILGDTLNYWIGHRLGLKVFKKDNARFFKLEHLEKTRRFYAKYGGKTIILARFIPIVRTFAPFVAGVGKMHYGQFLTYNVVGGLLWVSLFTFGGYFFGNLPFVKENFHYAIVGIIVISVLPAVYEYMRHKKDHSIITVPPKEEYEKIENTFQKKHLTG